MNVVIVPEPTDEERQALLAALEERSDDTDGSAWRQAALLEATDTDQLDP